MLISFNFRYHGNLLLKSKLVVATPKHFSGYICDGSDVIPSTIVTAAML